MGLNLVTVSFYNGGGSTVKTPNRPIDRCKSRKQRDFLRHSFFKDYILEKENTHIPIQLLDSSFLDWDYIPEQGKVLDTVQPEYVKKRRISLSVLDITTRVLLPK